MGDPDLDPLTIVVGAGTAGLSCARVLADAGRRVLVVDRAGRVGGRTATRQFQGQPIDHGAPFFHGRDPEFLAALDATPGSRVEGWPRVVAGPGSPREPQGFAEDERRVAFAEGASTFSKHMARELDLRLESRVVAIDVVGPRLRVRLHEREALAASNLVLALAAEQSLGLLGTLGDASDEVLGMRDLLSRAESQPCLALFAVYPRDARRPPWDVYHPEESSILWRVVHDSSKRPEGGFLTMVFQARPAWSRQHISHRELWPVAILSEAVRLLGSWAARPRFLRPHRWRYAAINLSLIHI